jgi:uncharacterized membrane protein YccC
MREALRIGTILGLVVLILILDVVTPLGVTGWVLYMIPMTLTAFWLSGGFTLLMAAICSVLLFLGYAFSPSGTPEWMALTNRSVGVFVMFAVAMVLERLAKGK